MATKEMTPRDLAIFLRKLDWTQEHFAERVWVHPNTVSSWMTGRSKIPGPVRAYVVLINELNILLT